MSISPQSIQRTHAPMRALVVACAMLCCAHAAAQVVVVLSSEAKPYRQAAAAYTTSIEELDLSVTTVQFAALDEALLHALLAEKPLVVTAIGSEAAESLRRRLPPEVPLTYCMVADPSAAGLTSSPPASGVSTDVPVEDQFEIIKSALPRTRTVGMLYQGESERSAGIVEQAQAALPTNWRLVAVSISRHSSVAEAVNALLREDIDVVWTAADSEVYDAATVRALLLASVRRKIPVFGFSSGFVRAGALLGISVDPAEQGRQCAEITEQALQKRSKGQIAQRESSWSVSDQVPRFRIEANLVVAEMLGIRLNDTFKERADHLITPE